MISPSFWLCWYCFSARLDAYAASGEQDAMAEGKSFVARGMAEFARGKVFLSGRSLYRCILIGMSYASKKGGTRCSTNVYSQKQMENTNKAFFRLKISCS